MGTFKVRKIASDFDSDMAQMSRLKLGVDRLGVHSGYTEGRRRQLGKDGFKKDEIPAPK